MPSPPKPPRPPSYTGYERDVRRAQTPPRGVGLTEPPATRYDGFEGPTPPVSDPEIFRAIRELHSQFERSKSEAATSHGALAREVNEVKTEVALVKNSLNTFTTAMTTMGQQMHDIATSNAELNGQVKVILMDRQAPGMTMTSTKTLVEGTVSEALAERILDERKDAIKFRRGVWLKIVAIMGTILVALIGVLVSQCFHTTAPEAPTVTVPAEP